MQKESFFAGMLNLFNILTGQVTLDESEDNSFYLEKYKTETKIKENVKKKIKIFFREVEHKKRFEHRDSLILICFSCQVEIGQDETSCPRCNGKEFTSTIVRSNSVQPRLLGI